MWYVIVFLIGLALGTFIGFVFAAIVSAARRDDDLAELRESLKESGKGTDKRNGKSEENKNR